MSKQKNAVVGVDFQNDFVLPSLDEVLKLKGGAADDYVAGYDYGALSVPGGVDDAIRFAKFIQVNGARLDEINLTHDCHDLHIATPIMWVDRDGNHPAPFTHISYQMAKDRIWRINSPVASHQQRGIDYLKQLEDDGRYVLTIWNHHCQIGSLGAAIYKPVIDAAVAWRDKYVATLEHVTKGSNPWTEHYSGMLAAVVDSNDRTTGLNKPFIKKLQTFDNIYFGGEALNFCVRETMLDIIRNFDPDNVKKIVLLTDCVSAIPDPPGQTLFQSFTDSFMDEALAAGMRTALSTDLI